MAKTVASELVSGWLGNPRFEIESLLPGAGAAVCVQLRNEQDAMNLLRWPVPALRGPRAEIPELTDGDAFCDAVIEAVHAWVATFPLFLVNEPEPAPAPSAEREEGSSFGGGSEARDEQG